MNNKHMLKNIIAGYKKNRVSILAQKKIYIQRHINQVDVEKNMN